MAALYIGGGRWVGRPIELPTRGDHPRQRTWPHGLTLSTAAPASESKGRRKGKKEEGKEVRWRLTGGTGSTAALAPAGGFGCARLGCSWAESGSMTDARLAAWFSIYLIP
jgi:hypothetical protein